MIFSHKTQTISIALFACAMFLSAIYIVLRCFDVNLPEAATHIAITCLGLTICITALIAPFSKEKVENETVKSIRTQTASAIMAVCFCVIMLYNMLNLVFTILDMDSLMPDLKLVSLRGILLIEVIYFIILKARIRQHLSKR